jgi:predicted RNA-binding Zn ribbon-like protein
VPTAAEPADVALVRSFANTLDVDEGTDSLDSTAGLAAWLEGAGLGSGPVEADDLELATRLRNALRMAVEEDGGGHEELDGVLAELPLRAGVASDDAVLVPVDDGVKGALERIAAGIASSVMTGTWPRLKICSADDCRWAFYDLSKNRSGKWCSMRVCGNRHKTKSYRQRHGSPAQ